MPRSRALTALILFALALAAHAQYSIANIVIQNGAPYTDPEILTVSGLAPGQLLTHDSLANATQHLVDTGLFADAETSVSGQGKARTITVALKPIPLNHLLPVSFENLVWFTPDELTQGIHSRVPLYRGFAAEAGNTPDAIQSALRQMLTEKSIDARLSFQVANATAQHPARVFNFRIDHPSIHLADVKLSISAPAGAAVQLTPGFQAAVNKATRSPFNEGLTGTTIDDLLLPPARNFGYVTAHLDNIQRTVAPAANGLAVTLTTRVVTGEAYKISSLTWQPTPIYTEADFKRDATLHPGDLASTYALNQTDNHILAAYLAHGYMDAIILALPMLDETTHTVAYAPTVTPGEIYHLKTVTPLNLSPEAQQEFDANWHMKPGDPFSAAYVEGFIQANKSLPHLTRYEASYQTAADPETHQVDLTITFAPSSH